ncbi:MAG: right-handed parallel beta-helix repeat-containing protein [Pseudomonadota bacterium]
MSVFAAVALTATLTVQAALGQSAMQQFANVSCAYDVAPNPANYVRTVRDLRSTTTVTLEGRAWDNTLILGCQIDGARGDGIEIRNVKNLTIAGCTIRDVRGTGIRFRSSGGTSGVKLIGNRIINAGENGISAAKRRSNGVDHTNLVIVDNVVEDSGRRGRSGLTHGIYSQVSDVTIFRNEVSGKRDGNGISIRSSGVVSCNSISGESYDNKPGIRYYADNYTGPSRSLLIRNNRIRGSTPGIDIRTPDGWAQRKTEALVTDFQILDNRINSADRVAISRFWREFDAANFVIQGNRRIGG